jgi:hypothetical protein
MILQCGYLNKSVFYYHYVQNVIISKAGWTKLSVKYNDNIIKEYVNSDIDYKFELTQDNQYNIILKCNDTEIINERQLFNVDLIVDGVDDKIFTHKFEEGLIVDH